MKIHQCTTDLRPGQTLSSKLPFVQPKAVGQALQGQPSEHVQHADITDEAETTNTSKITDEAEMKIHTINGIAWLIC